MLRLAASLLPVVPLLLATTAVDRPPSDLIELAGDVVACARAEGLLEVPAGAPGALTIIDYRLPSTERRLWIVDEASGEVLFHERVAHGKNTGGDAARTFSNVPGSLQSSVGLFRTAEPYVGKHGRSLRLDGLEPGFNDRARERAIVLHGADYVSESFIEQVGRLGRSWGCPAVSRDVSDGVIDRIAGGSPLFVYADDAAWLESSALLSCARDRR